MYKSYLSVVELTNKIQRYLHCFDEHMLFYPPPLLHEDVQIVSLQHSPLLSLPYSDKSQIST